MEKLLPFNSISIKIKQRKNLIKLYHSHLPIDYKKYQELAKDLESINDARNRLSNLASVLETIMMRYI